MRFCYPALPTPQSLHTIPSKRLHAAPRIVWARRWIPPSPILRSCPRVHSRSDGAACELNFQGTVGIWRLDSLFHAETAPVPCCCHRTLCFSYCTIWRIFCLRFQACISQEGLWVSDTWARWSHGSRRLPARHGSFRIHLLHHVCLMTLPPADMNPH